MVQKALIYQCFAAFSRASVQQLVQQSGRKTALRQLAGALFSFARVARVGHILEEIAGLALQQLTKRLDVRP